MSATLGMTTGQSMHDGSCPYVGLRPFDESDRRFFIGRDGDAQLLRNKIFSAPLTLFYAPSGVGKTSMLKTLVIPDLRDPAREARVVYMDRWEAGDSLGAIADAITPDTEVAADVTAAPGRRLATLIAESHRQDDRTLVLILDQFEQFLIRHAGEFKAFGAELAAVLRSGLDCHVVLSLREEFLASLNVFRRDIPTLLDSTYRLEYLMQDKAQEAIRTPAERAGAEIEEALVERILSDLTKASATADMDSLAVRPVEAIELPFLQLICEKLWQASDRRRLTVGLYDKVYGKATFIEAFRKELQDGLTESRKNDAAVVLDKLAPRAGVKRSYTLEDLVDECELPQDRVETVLSHLEVHGVARTVGTTGKVAHELYHDAFTRLLRGWIDERLEEMKHAAQRRKQRMKLFAGVGIAVAILALGGFLALRLYNEYQRTTGAIAGLKAMSPKDRQREAEPVLSNVAGYLWSKGKIDRLFDLLKENQELVPANFGFDTHLREAMPEARDIEQPAEPAKLAADTPRERASGKNRQVPRGDAAGSVGEKELQISISSRRYADNARLLYTWRIEASRLIEEWGLPTPVRLRIQRHDGLSGDQVRFVIRTVAAGSDIREQDPGTGPAGSGSMPSISVPTRPDHRVILDDDLKKVTQSLPSRLTALLVPIGGHMARGWLVPRWTLPIWKAAGVRVWPSEYAIIFAVRERLLQEPAPLLGADVVRRLLDAQKGDFCETVEEALLARGGDETVRRDLIALVRNGQKIASLAYILDALAAYPGDIPSEDVAKTIAAGRTPERIGHRLHISPANSRCEPVRDKDRHVQARARTGALGMPSPPLITMRLEVGEELAKLFADGEGKPKRELQAAIVQARSGTYERFGVMPSDIEPKFGRARSALPNELVLHLPWSGQPVSFAIDPQADKERKLAALRKSLEEHLARHLPRMLTAEQVRRAVSTLPAGVQNWLLQRYSITDLKLILREVVAASPQTQDTGSVRTSVPGNDATLRHLPWLLGSLVFWDSACGQHDVRCLAAVLRETQRARLTPEARRSAGTSPSDLVESGIATLVNATEAGGVAEAGSTFARAVKTNQTAARKRFLALWPEHADPIQYMQLLKRAPMCSLPEVDRLGSPQAFAPPDLQALSDIRDYLDHGALDCSTEEKRKLQLCRYWGLLATPAPGKAAGDLLENLLACDPASNWSPEELFLTGYWTLGAVQQGVLPPVYYNRAGDLLGAAFRGLTDDELRSTRFALLETLCQDSKRYRAGIKALSPIAEAVPESAWIPMQLGVRLSEFPDHKEDALYALALLDRAERNLGKARKPDQQQMRLWITYGRAKANRALAYLNRPDSAERAFSQYMKLLTDTGRNGKSPIPRDEIYAGLFDLNLLAGRKKQAQEMLDEGLREQPESMLLLQSRVYFHLAEGNADEAAREAERAFNGPLRDDPVGLFVLTMTRLLARELDEAAEYDTRRFLSSGHEYRDYLRMMLFWRLGGVEGKRARELMDERWKSIDTASWEERLARQDLDVWREMYIGYYAGALPREKLSAPLADAASFDKSGLAGLGQSHRTFLAEFHFYDALLQLSSGEPATRQKRYREALKKSVESKAIDTFEYHMARYLLSR